jgi:glycosyltransferase involved in cell wall biosynthesis
MTPMRPRVLFLLTACPIGGSGASVRTRQTFALLQNHAEVHAVALTERPWSGEQLKQAKAKYPIFEYVEYEQTPIETARERLGKLFNPRFLNTNGVRVPAGAAQRILNLASQVDVVWIHTLKVANAFRRFHWDRTLVDVDDFPSGFHRSVLKDLRFGRDWLSRAYLSLTWKRREALLHRRFSQLVVCKESDRHAFPDPSRVRVMPNGMAASTPILDRRPIGSRLGMLGDFEFLPNKDGITWFVREVWAPLRTQAPQAALRLVGKGSREFADRLKDPAIQGCGYVDDLDTELASWSAMIAPTRLGGGTSLKVVEGLARGTPLVATHHGARGCSLVSGQDAFVTDSPQEFADGCHRLLADPALQQSFSHAGRAVFEAHLTWEAIGACFSDLFTSSTQSLRS